MSCFIAATLLSLAGAQNARPVHHFAEITAVDAEKGTVTFIVRAGKDKDLVSNVTVVKNCVIKEGVYRLGKPAKTIEGDDIEDGLKNPVFKKVTDKNPMRVDIYTAEEDDADKGIKKGDVVKILVNPPPKKKE